MIISKVYKENDYGVIEVNSPKYGVFKFLIDEEDIERCSKMNWSVYHSQNHKGRQRGYFYGQTNKKSDGRKSMLLHRFIVNAPPDKYVDHIDFNTLDNRKSNLRLCDPSENVAHGRGRSDNTSGTIGVTWNKREGKWMAYVHLKNKFLNLGLYIHIEDAIKIRKEAEVIYFGEFAPEKEVS